MEDFGIAEIAWSDEAAVAAAKALVLRVFDDPHLYAAERIDGELQPAAPPLLRCFFAAYQHGQMVGVGGIKSADWASNTYLLYLSVVAPEYRGRGIARALLKARLDWLQRRVSHGRVLVSSNKSRRFLDLGFRQINAGERGGKALMFLEY